MLQTRPRRELLWSAATLLAIACAATSDDDIDAAVDRAGSPDARVDAAQECRAGERQSCVCAAGGVGERTCRDGDFGACEQCKKAPNDGKPRCVAGTYRAVTKVAYRAGPAGICFLAAPSEAVQFDGEMLFTLEKSGNGEFYTVGNGCLRVPGQGEDAGPGDIDWRAEVVGSVDCATGELNAEIRSTYFVVSVCTLGQIPTRYFAKGPFRGVFNPETSSFEDGTVEMVEPPVLFGDPPGGTGTWSAKLDPEAADAGPSGPCLGDTVFDESLFPKDGG